MCKQCKSVNKKNEVLNNMWSHANILPHNHIDKETSFFVFLLVFAHGSRQNIKVVFVLLNYLVLNDKWWEPWRPRHDWKSHWQTNTTPWGVHMTDTQVPPSSPPGNNGGEQGQDSLLSTTLPGLHEVSALRRPSHVGTRPQLTDIAWRIIQDEIHHWPRQKQHETARNSDLGLLVLLALLWPGTA